jgi:NAD(P)-dependent dehydrogenase (short-subunit alcohol dehydrogenase family)
MSTDLAGKVAWITGASAGLGARFAQVLAGAGAIVALSARRADRLEALAAEIASGGGRALAVPADTSVVADIRAAAARIEAALGPIDILVNNAGTSRQARLEDFAETDYDAVLDTNLKGPFFAAQAAARQMIAHRRDGRIVNIASIAAVRTLGHQAPYGMAKAGMVQMTHSMAREWGRHAPKWAATFGTARLARNWWPACRAAGWASRATSMRCCCCCARARRRASSTARRSPWTMG